MSFSSSVKDELVKIQTDSPCCRHAQVYGMLLFGRAFSVSTVSLSTENRNVAENYINSVSELTGIKPEILNRGGKKITVGLTSKSQCLPVLEKFGHGVKELSRRINRANFSNECCFSAFLRGAFLSCGTLTTPEKNYRLEFVVPHLKLCNDFAKLMEELDLKPKQVKRKNSYILFFRDSETIEDVLTIMGAVNSTLELMGIKIHKDMRNMVNRKVNFETANITRTVEAASAQIKAIETIVNKKGMDFLPPALREVATLRIENPDATLRELGEKLSKPISRSGVNHRLNKIIEISMEI